MVYWTWRCICLQGLGGVVATRPVLGSPSCILFFMEATFLEGLRSQRMATIWDENRIDIILDMKAFP